MDLFAKQSGSQYVTAFAGRLLLAMGKGIARAPERIKSAFAEEDAEAMWALAMVVVQWHAENLPASESQNITAALQGFGVSSVAANLNFFRDQLLPFVKSAHQAQNDAQLAAAGVYFIAAVEQIGLTLLKTALKADAVRVLQQKIIARLPLPDDVKAGYYQALGALPKGTTSAPATPPQPSRADRFDRADFTPRTTRSSAQVQDAAASSRSQARKDVKPSASASLPAPILAKADVTRAYLFTLGWEGDEVDRFLRGPGAKKRA